VVDPVANISYTVPASRIDYVLLGASAYLDTTGRFRYIGEAVVVSDGVALVLDKAAADVVSMADESTWNLGKTLAESVSFADTLTVTVIFLRELFDAVSVPDAVVRNVAKAAASAVVSSDTATRSVAKSVSDAQTVVDSASRAVAKALTETFSLADSTAVAYSKLEADAVALADTIVRATIKSVADVQAVVDTSVRNFTKSLADGVAINDGFGAEDGLNFVFSTTFANVAFAADSATLTTNPRHSETVSTSDGGFVISQDYCDLTYFAEDYVGTAVVF
jgi:stage V sporulation protein SpoVS